MKLTLSLIKADVGSIGGHTMPSKGMVKAAKKKVKEAVSGGLIFDGFVSFTGDDIALLLSHEHGEESSLIHKFAWDIFLESANVAKKNGLYGAGQDLLVDAPSLNLRGAGPAVAEMEVSYGDEEKNRPVEAFLAFAADKCGPGAYNLPIFSAFADPMFSSGLMLPNMIKGFEFEIIDMDNAKVDSVIKLDAPEDYYKITALLRDNERFGIKAVRSRTYDLKAVSVSAQRMHSIAGKYVGKDDPVSLVRVQGVFPAPEEVVSPYTMAHYVGGGARGSHVMPLMPVAINTPITGSYCIPMVSCLAFSIDSEGKFSESFVDLFSGLAWDEVRSLAQKKSFEIRKQGWSGAAMLPYSELEYGGFRETAEKLFKKFS